MRVYPIKGELWLKEGDYGQKESGRWVVRPPGCHSGGIPKHNVLEHSDGTITVTPSILLSDVEPDGTLKEIWHGYLTKGEFKEV